ncbi:MAG: 50S ribosomal protein L23 [Candidatus Saccharibacteria bacterium]
MTTHISVFPRSTEKAYAQSKNNVYVFDVPVSANKQQIIAAIEDQFKVKIVNIKTLIQNGKAVRASRGKRSQPGITTRKDAKKAYVTLAEGDSIKVFDEVAAEEPVKKTEKKEKK